MVGFWSKFLVEIPFEAHRVDLDRGNQRQANNEQHTKTREVIWNAVSTMVGSSLAKSLHERATCKVNSNGYKVTYWSLKKTDLF